jgi:2-polyprenyl-3-methyl-5-hydroxy-6-metoxy-1,4-benzoquinol methylase
MGGLMLNYLLKHNIVEEENIQEFRLGTRDNPNAKVLQCTISGTKFLDKVYKKVEDYEMQKELSFGLDASLAECRKGTREDTNRRKEFLLNNRLNTFSYLDFGCGCGGMLEAMMNPTSNIAGLEIQKNKVNGLRLEGYHIYESIEQLTESNFSLVSMFHVLEHLSNPIETLSLIFSVLQKGGALVIEVPNSNDALMEYYKCESFIKHTLWSEHLVLYTKDSLRKVVEKAGFKNIELRGVQRYPISNHIKWITGKKIKNINKYIDSKLVMSAYEEKLDSMGMTDTLICICYK